MLQIAQSSALCPLPLSESQWPILERRTSSVTADLTCAGLLLSLGYRSIQLPTVRSGLPPGLF